MILKKWWFWALIVAAGLAIAIPIIVSNNSVQTKIKRIMDDDSLSNREKITKLYQLNMQTASRSTKTAKSYTADDIWKNMTNSTGSNYHTTTTTSTTYGNSGLILSYVKQLQEDMPAPDRVYLAYKRYDSYNNEHELRVNFDMRYYGFKDVYYLDYDLGGPSAQFFTKFSYNGTSKTIEFDNGENGYSSIHGSRSGDLFYADHDVPASTSSVTINITVHPYSGDVNGFSYYHDTYYSYNITFNPASLQSQSQMTLSNPTITYSMPSGIYTYY